MSPAADDGLLKFSHHFQGVPQVTRGLRLPQPAKYEKKFKEIVRSDLDRPESGTTGSA